jgi:hypothetical protein
MIKFILGVLVGVLVMGTAAAYLFNEQQTHQLDLIAEHEERIQFLTSLQKVVANKKYEQGMIDAVSYIHTVCVTDEELVFKTIEPDITFLCYERGRDRVYLNQHKP